MQEINHDEDVLSPSCEALDRCDSRFVQHEMQMQHTRTQSRGILTFIGLLQHSK